MIYYADIRNYCDEINVM